MADCLADYPTFASLGPMCPTGRIRVAHNPSTKEVCIRLGTSFLGFKVLLKY